MAARKSNPGYPHFMDAKTYNGKRYVLFNVGNYHYQICEVKPQGGVPVVKDLSDMSGQQAMEVFKQFRPGRNKNPIKRKPARKTASKTARRSRKNPDIHVDINSHNGTMEVRRAKNPKPRGTHPYAVMQASNKSGGEEICVCKSKAIATQLADVLTRHARKGVFFSVFTLH